MMRAGFSRLDITPAQPTYLAGYRTRDRPHEGVQAPIFVRGSYFKDQAGSAAVILEADLVSFRGAATRIIHAVSEQLALPEDAVFLAGVHSHSAPSAGHEGNTQWMSFLVASSVAAAAIARTRAQPTALTFRRGNSTVNINRRERNTGGHYSGPEGNERLIRLGKNPDGPVDHELLVLLATGESGEPRGALINFGCHGTGLWHTNYRISGDWMGNAAARLEQTGGFGTVAYLNGATANVDPIVAYQHEFAPLEPVVDQFVQDFSRTMASSPRPIEGSIRTRRKTLRLPRKQSAVENGDGRYRSVALRRLSVGNLEFLFFPGELFCQTGMAVKAQDPERPVAVVTYADDSDRGYVPVKEAYDDGGYEVGTSPYSEDAEAIVRQGLLALLDE